MKHTKDDYLADPFFGDESELVCRKVILRVARKEHVCYTIGDVKDGHTIKPGETYRYEKALVDRSFWGEYKICLQCMDRFIENDY